MIDDNQTFLFVVLLTEWAKNIPHQKLTKTNTKWTQTRRKKRDYDFLPEQRQYTKFFNHKYYNLSLISQRRYDYQIINLKQHYCSTNTVYPLKLLKSAVQIVNKQTSAALIPNSQYWQQGTMYWKSYEILLPHPGLTHNLDQVQTSIYHYGH